MTKPTILLMHGYIGFGKTTIAKQFEKFGYIRYTHDEFMSKIYGDDPSNEDFEKYYCTVSNLIYDLTKNAILNGINVILDFGFWSRNDRRDIIDIIKSWNIPVNMIFINVMCDMDLARERCLSRLESRKDGDLKVSIEIFDMKRYRFQPITDSELDIPVLNIQSK